MTDEKEDADLEDEDDEEEEAPPSSKPPARTKAKGAKAEAPSPEANEPKKPDPQMRAALAGVVVAGVSITAIMFGLYGTKHVVGVFVGAVVAFLNLAAFLRIGDALLSRMAPKGTWGAAGLVKVVFLFVGAWILLKRGIASPLEFVIGFGALPLGIVLGIALAPMFQPIPKR